MKIIAPRTATPPTTPPTIPHVLPVEEEFPLLEAPEEGSAEAEEVTPV